MMALTNLAGVCCSSHDLDYGIDLVMGGHHIHLGLLHQVCHTKLSAGIALSTPCGSTG
jgi:hypothetical protein